MTARHKSMNLLTVRGGDLEPEEIGHAIVRFERRVKARLGVSPDAVLHADEGLASDGEKTVRYDPGVGYEVAADMFREQAKIPISIDGAAPQLRADSAGTFFVNELTQTDPVVLRTKYKRLNSLIDGNFPVTMGAVPPGVRQKRIVRLSWEGKAKIIRNDDTQIPNVAIDRKEEFVKVIYGAVGQSYNMWDEQSADYASLDLAQEFGMVSERALGQFINDINFNGDIPSKVYGILTHPACARFHTSTPFTSASTADDILAALNRGANYASTGSGDTFASDTLALSPRAHHYLNTRLVGAGAPNVSILQAFLAMHQTVKTVRIMQELQDSTSARKDKFFFYANDKLALELAVGQPYVLIPGIPGQMRRSAVAYCSCLGAIERDSGNNTLMTAVVPAS